MNKNKITYPITIQPVKIVVNNKFDFVPKKDFENLTQKCNKFKDFASKQASNAGSTLEQYKNLK